LIPSHDEVRNRKLVAKNKRDDNFQQLKEIQAQGVYPVPDSEEAIMDPPFAPHVLLTLKSLLKT